MTAPHPTERRLAAFVDGRLDEAEASEVAEHVRSCPLCGQRLAYCDAPASEPDAPLLEVPTTAFLPAGAAWEEREDDPAPGDVWRLSWDGVVELAVIRSSDPENVRASVLPVLDVDLADEWALVTEIVTAGAGVPAAISAAHETSVPWCVLDARVGQLPGVALAQLVELRTAFRTGAALSPGIIVGAPVWTRLDERAEAIELVADRFQDLANVEPLPADQEVSSSAQPMPTYDELEAAGLPPQRILAVGRGDAPTPEEAAAIEARTGRAVSPRSPALTLVVRRELDRPLWRPRLRQTARRRGVSEADLRASLAVEVQPQRLAARGTGGDPVPLPALLDQLLDE